MAVTPAMLREAFPALADVNVYTDPSMNLWIGVATKLVNEDRWGDLTDTGIMLYAAHNIVIDAMDGRIGVVPGASMQGVVTSKSVGGVSVGIDASSASEADAGNWNLTTYGTRYYRLMRMMGAGPVQVGAPGDSPTTSGATGAWPGPYSWPF